MKALRRRPDRCGIEANIESAIVVQGAPRHRGRTVDGRKVSADQDFPIRLQRNPRTSVEPAPGIGMNACRGTRRY